MTLLSKEAVAFSLLGVGVGFVLAVGIPLLGRSSERARKTKGDSCRDTESGTCQAFDFEEARLEKAEVWAIRKQLFCSAQSVSYSNSEPLLIVQGKGQFLVDENGVEYLDTRNNVGHVGWQHPGVTKAIMRQLAKTNSNTRYLHQNTVLLASKLLSKFPPQLNKVFFVNSGSEANDLALRLARAVNDGDCIVEERAYHGHTTAVLDLSPYKFLGKGGKGKPDWVEVVPCPDAYRCRKPEESMTAFGERYAKKVEEACNKILAKGRRVSAFFMESGMSVAGVILPPQGYLKRVYEIVRSYGGVCVADEVQVGFGRFGTHYWGFEQQQVVPDIVTMGKPFGNGFPLAAVVCTSRIAEAFTNGMEYFNTFGGNPVACAAGLAVMETIERERLQECATQNGARLKGSLEGLMQTPHGALIGDIRGSGLFLGIEFVRDRNTKEPATEEVSWIATKLLREHHILTSCDGKFYNVLVLKPPMVFSAQDCDRFVAALSAVLQKLATSDIAGLELTPT